MSALRRHGRRLLASLARAASRRYFAGPTQEEAIAVHRVWAEQARATTLAYWDGRGEPPDRVLAHYGALLERVAAERIDSYLSIKPWAFRFDAAAFAGLLQQADAAGVALHLDSLQGEWVDDALALVPGPGRAGRPAIGCTLPARWQRSRRDAEFLLEHDMVARVVKGQRQGSDEVADVGESFLALVERFARVRAHVRVASHDETLVRRALECLRRHGAPGELELLHGLPMRRVLAIADELMVPVRVYVPFGYGYLPYSMAAMRRNPRIAWGLLKDALRAAPTATQTTGARIG